MGWIASERQVWSHLWIGSLEINDENCEGKVEAIESGPCESKVTQRCKLDRFGVCKAKLAGKSKTTVEYGGKVISTFKWSNGAMSYQGGGTSNSILGQHNPTTHKGFSESFLVVFNWKFMIALYFLMIVRCGAYETSWVMGHVWRLWKRVLEKRGFFWEISFIYQRIAKDEILNFFLNWCKIRVLWRFKRSFVKSMITDLFDFYYCFFYLTIRYTKISSFNIYRLTFNSFLWFYQWMKFLHLENYFAF